MVNTKRRYVSKLFGGVLGMLDVPGQSHVIPDTFVVTDSTIRPILTKYLDGDPSIPNINEWDVTRVTDMQHLFAQTLFNEDISNWDVSNVINMSYMFSGCVEFDQSLDWDVENVTNMSNMFSGCVNFNRSLYWDTGKVTDMSEMFKDCTLFNGWLEWNTSNVTNMSKMFENCINLEGLCQWDTGKVENMTRMFLNTKIPGRFKPHLKMQTPPPANGFDIILYVLMHGTTITSCPTKHEPNFANATLLEATPCGVNNFCRNSQIEANNVAEFVEFYKDTPTFVTDLQAELRHVKRREIVYTPAEKYQSEHKWFVDEQGWQIITNGYMDRYYEADRDKTSYIQKIIVCYSDPNVLMEGENLYQSYNIRSRTDLMHLLKDSGYGKPLIVDFSCGGFPDKKIDDAERRRLIESARRLGVAGGKTKRRKNKKMKRTLRNRW